MPIVNRRPLAALDILDIWDHIADDNMAAADRWVDALDAAFSRLATQPIMGRARPEIARISGAFRSGATSSTTCRCPMALTLCVYCTARGTSTGLWAMNPSLLASPVFLDVPAAEQSWSAIAIFDHSVGAVGHQESFAAGCFRAVKPVAGRNRSGQSFGIHQDLTSRLHALGLLPHQRVSGASCRARRLAQTRSAQRMVDFSSTNRCLD